jgi:putative endonuclease
MLHKRAKNREKGNIGEDIACKFLEANGFCVVDRNYQKKWGELDIVAREDATKGDSRSNALHFFEVKSVMRNFSAGAPYKPEDNVNNLKVRHLQRIIQTYLAEKGRGLGADFHFHVLCVFMNEKTRRAKVKWIKDVIL